MNKILVALKSRTVWTVVAIILVNGLPEVRNLVPSGLLPVIDAVLLILSAYFRVNRRADL